VLPASCCEKNSQKTLRQFSQKAHDTGSTTMAWLMREKVKKQQPETRKNKEVAQT
jgi:hypothetical protein